MNVKMIKFFLDICNDVEIGISLFFVFCKYLLYFDVLYCNLVEVGEVGGILDILLDCFVIY